MVTDGEKSAAPAGDASPPCELEITDIAFGGAGVARADGAVYFVPGTCLGEVVRASVTEVRSSFRKARLLEVLRPSPDRLRPPDCLVMVGDTLRVLPAAVYGHVTHEEEVRCKQRQLLSFLQRQAGLPQAEELLAAPFLSPKAVQYRNKTTLHCAPRVRPGTGRAGRILGYVLEDNKTVFDVTACPLSVSAINTELSIIREDPAFWRYIRPGDDLVLRWTRRSGAVVYVNRRGESHAPAPPVTEETPVLGTLEVPVRGFFQTNPEVGAALTEAVAAVIREIQPRRFLDLYCGVGVFGLSAARLGVPAVTGIDSGADVIRAARQNARRLGLDRSAAFACADVAAAADAVLSECTGPGSMVLVDPPRDGLAPRGPYAKAREMRVLQALLRHPPETLLYVSCNPATLARDLALLTGEGGYVPRSVRLFDMFPRTAHFETLVRLTHP